MTTRIDRSLLAARLREDVSDADSTCRDCGALVTCLACVELAAASSILRGPAFVSEAEDAASDPGYLQGSIACDDPIFDVPEFVTDAENANWNVSNQVKPACGFQAFGMMPPCVLDAGHEDDHQDGHGGLYGQVPDGQVLVQVEGSKELRYAPEIDPECIACHHSLSISRNYERCPASVMAAGLDNVVVACGCDCKSLDNYKRACAQCNKYASESRMTKRESDQRLVCSQCDSRTKNKIAKSLQPTLFGQQSLI